MRISLHLTIPVLQMQTLFQLFKGNLSKGVSAVEHIESLNIVQTMVVFTRGC